MEKMTKKQFDRMIDTKTSIMIEWLNAITGCTYSQGYNIIVRSTIYKELREGNSFTIYESPQANLDDIGRELREKGDELGNIITTENIIKASYKLRDEYLKIQKGTVQGRDK